MNSLAVVLASGCTGVLGLAFWAIAARLYPAAEVGVAAAMIFSATMLATLANLSLGAMYERFLPLAGRRAAPLLRRGYLAVVGLALVLACGLIAFGPRAALFHSRWELVTYPAFVAVLALFALLDNTVAGLGVARWGAAKNTVHGAVKLVGILALAGTGSALAITMSWGLTAAVAVIWVMVAIRRRVRYDDRYSAVPSLPPRRELWHYFGASYGISALASVAPLVVPLLVVTRIGPEASAYFAVTWSIVGAFYIVLSLLVSPFVAECAAHPDRIGSLSASFAKMIAAAALLGGLGLAFVAPIALGLIGTDYREAGTPLLHLAAFFMPLTVVGAVYVGLARVHRRLTLAVLTQCLVTVVVIGGTAMTTGTLGVRGVGVSYLVAEALAAVVLIGPLVRWLLELNTNSPARSVRLSTLVGGER
ncbi:lipopolysaccharide biosynthesis protein [Mycobacterium yunnanensis]|uniref:Lipopolysaccharide biosynthesis protein n=1 Tax=Mycobacterium yunnanensis TaxID=368477 RepID=A0A9X3C343_9MYCO|nr:lipopolysaccharide biosynthesis protein [Mycobacterium yunnanensis]MCV7423758.1 lipopolysaccharide biosynthesis protein [Mycobacterium yunnanensis]